MHLEPPQTARAALLSRNRASGNPCDVTAVILAAGRGARLGGRCKPLVIVGGVPLLQPAAGHPPPAGVRRIVVVVAALDGEVAAFCRTQLPGVEVAAAP